MVSFTPTTLTLCTHGIGVWVGHSAGLDGHFEHGIALRGRGQKKYLICIQTVFLGFVTTLTGKYFFGFIDQHIIIMI
jgi:hypothetical protein